MSSLQKFLIVAGVALVIVGLFLPFISKLGLGKLPGDIAFKGENFSFYFPITTMILISLVVTLILRLWGK